MSEPRWFMELCSLFSDPRLDEVLVNSTLSLLLTSAEFGMQVRVSPFAERGEMGLALQEFALGEGVRLDHLCPAAGGVVGGGAFRWHGLLPPAAASGPLLSVRRHRFGEITIQRFLVSATHEALLREQCVAGKPLVIIGSTGCGKTTLLAAILKEYALNERVIILEELAELPLCSPSWLRLLAKEENIDGKGQLTIVRLFKDSLRLRPERFVFGELQRGQVGCFIESIWSGHGGSAATFHGASLADAMRRFAGLLRQETGIASGEVGIEVLAVVLERGNPPRISDVCLHKI